MNWIWLSRKQKHQDEVDMSGENRLMLRAIDARMKRALRPGKFILGLCGVMCIVLALVAGQLEYYHFTHPTTNAIVANSIANCDSNNQYRDDQTKIWQDYLALQAKESSDTATEFTALLTVLTDGNPTEEARIRAILVASGKTDTTDQNTFMQKVMTVNSPRDCVAANSISGG